MESKREGERVEDGGREKYEKNRQVKDEKRKIYREGGRERGGERERGRERGE